jgi:hypothetical protein
VNITLFIRDQVQFKSNKIYTIEKKDKKENVLIIIKKNQQQTLVTYKTVNAMNRENTQFLIIF